MITTRYTTINERHISRKENEILIFGKYHDIINPLSKFDKDGVWDEKTFFYYPPLAFTNGAVFLSYHLRTNGRERWLRALLPSEENTTNLLSVFRKSRGRIQRGMDFRDVMTMRFGDNPINETYGFAHYVHRILYSGDSKFIKLVTKHLKLT